MSDEKLTNQQAGNLRAAYLELCNSYRAIDDFRAKLLGYLPLATGTGMFFLFNNLTDVTKGFLDVIGVFGFVITLGLFSYEIYGIRKCGALIEAGKQMERSLGIDGQFKNRPREVAHLINEPFAAGVIYPTVLAVWMYLALAFSCPDAALPAAIVVFIVFFAGTLIYDFWLRKPSANHPEEQARKDSMT
ncbi:MAG: hypothetical protein JSW07_03830 [bacterium]|nr:MAG: hypothetical protein JSW07_03830 [bacterium]